jgi:hypothetical protein
MRRLPFQFPSEELRLFEYYRRNTMTEYHGFGHHDNYGHHDSYSHHDNSYNDYVGGHLDHHDDDDDDDHTIERGIFMLGGFIIMMIIIIDRATL